MNVTKKIISFVILGTILFSGCDKMLEVYPEDKKTGEQYWTNKSDIESTIIGAYSKLQGCVNSLFVWSELRGDYIVPPYYDANRFEVWHQQLTQDNSLSDWGSIYSAINMFNTVIDYAPLVSERDKTLTTSELNRFLAEAMTMRALCYFYLARSFETFPYITSSSKTDEQTYIVPGLPGSQVLDSLVNDLLWAEKFARHNFDDVVFETAKIKLLYEKGRVTQPAVWALLTDIYLTQDKYSEAVTYADKIINDSRYSLLAGSQWFEAFYPGNSSESILELQFLREYSNPGKEIIKWFSSLSSVDGEVWYAVARNVNTNTYLYWDGEDPRKVRTDRRGEGGTYPSRFLPGGQYGSVNGIMYSQVWKWSGKKLNGSSNSDLRDDTSNDPNWIFYRLSDIYLMKAEALNRLGSSTEAADLLNRIRDRADLTVNLTYNGVEELEGIILDERARELAFEGKRWYDLIRIAKRQDNYEVLADRVAKTRYMPFGQGIIKARLTEPLSWYFPIYKPELDKNYKLVQNKYYSIGK